MDDDKESSDDRKKRKTEEMLDRPRRVRRTGVMGFPFSIKCCLCPTANFPEMHR